MSVRRRVWGANKDKEAWIVNFTDANKRRRIKTFATKKEADRFDGVVRAVSAGQIPEPLTRGYRPAEFGLPLPSGWRRGQAAREEIAAAMRVAIPSVDPTTENVVVHVIAEMPPSHTVADVDNLLKPILDALKGVAWMDDTQVCELLVRRVPARRRHLTVKIWHLSGPVVAAHLNAMANSGHIATAKRP